MRSDEPVGVDAAAPPSNSDANADGAAEAIPQGVAASDSADLSMLSGPSLCHCYDFVFVLVILIFIGLIWVFYYHEPLPAGVVRFLGMDDTVYPRPNP
jgi:hypothetical protein